MELDDKLFQFLSPDDCYRLTADFINYVLDLNGSEFLVDVEDSHLVLIQKQMGISAHHLPAPSTYRSNEPAPPFHPHFPEFSQVSLPSSVVSSMVKQAGRSTLKPTVIFSPKPYDDSSHLLYLSPKEANEVEKTVGSCP